MSLQGIVGNRGLIEGLVAEMQRRSAHAYLLAGPSGIGKALIARALAHSVLCERSRGAEFCCAVENCPVRTTAAAKGRGRNSATTAPRCSCCGACVQIAAGVHPDFVYIARNPNRTEVLIEQVRELIVRLGMRPARGARRVAIIDDAATLNLPTQNALLKTLEEPPVDTTILMVSESERALLDTVRSRLRPVRFGPLDSAEIASVLIAREALTAERAGALARLARGSLARALALADGAEPPIGELLKALGRARTIDFAEAQSIAQQYFSVRAEAADNFELIARVLEEMLCFRLLGAELNAPSAEAARIMAEFAQAADPAILAQLMSRALEARSAIDAMATSRLQAETWWMDAGAAFRGE